MKKFSYKTVFLWNNKQLYIFYKYHTGLYIPAGLDFKYRNKKYSTLDIMNSLIRLYENNKFPINIYKPTYWFEKIEEKFAKFSKQCS